MNIDFEVILGPLRELSSKVLLPLLVIIIGLFVAWVIARIGAFLVRRGLERMNADQRSASLGTPAAITLGQRLAFWLLQNCRPAGQHAGVEHRRHRHAPSHLTAGVAHGVARQAGQRWRLPAGRGWLPACCDSVVRGSTSRCLTSAR
jgi:hypothetical protein